MPYFLLILTTLFWAGNFVLSRGMHTDIPPFSLSFWRWAVALLILLGFGIPHLWRQRQIALKHYRFITVQGLLGVAAFNSFIYLAIQTTTAINAALVNSSIPVLIAVFSWILYGEMMKPRQWAGVLVSLCGVLFIISRGEMVHLLTVRSNRGDLFVFAASLSWALYSANLKKYPKELHPFAYLSGIVLTGLAGILPFYLMEISSGQVMILNGATIVTIIYVAVFASILAFIFWNTAVRRIGANKAGLFIHLMPVFSTMLAVFFLGETLHMYHLLGIIFIFSGILMTTLPVPQK